jgi:hypothetical protein
MPMYRALIPMDATDAERGAAMLDLAQIHCELRDQGCEVIVAVDVTPDGDEVVLAFEEPVPAS